jgi:hypothetical protein
MMLCSPSPHSRPVVGLAAAGLVVAVRLGYAIRVARLVPGRTAR